ncbi:MAG TPA: hypothetical protein VFW11_12955 [Cyclobacteriaceae bacterium]|nr:hypothetical protein [Cyclobacteriaceae bacterium]
MKVSGNEILFIYNSKSIQDRRSFGYASALQHYVIREFDIQKDTLTETQLMEIADLLRVTPSQLMDQHSSIFKSKFADVVLTDEDALTALKMNADLLQTPIAIYHDHAEFVDSSFDFIKKDMSTKSISSEHANPEERNTEQDS